MYKDDLLTTHYEDKHAENPDDANTVANENPDHETLNGKGLDYSLSNIEYANKTDFRSAKTEVNRSFTSNQDNEADQAFKKNQRKSQSGSFKLNKGNKNKNYHYLKKAYGFYSMGDLASKRCVPPKNAHRQTLLKQNKGHMNYIVSFPDGHDPKPKVKQAKVIVYNSK